LLLLHHEDAPLLSGIALAIRLVRIIFLLRFFFFGLFLFKVFFVLKQELVFTNLGDESYRDDRLYNASSERTGFMGATARALGRLVAHKHIFTRHAETIRARACVEVIILGENIATAWGHEVMVIRWAVPSLFGIPSNLCLASLSHV